MKSHLKSALLAVTVCLPFSGGAAFAAPVTIGATFDLSITVPEDGATHAIDYTLTNMTTGVVNFNPITDSTAFISGDTSDDITLGTASLGTCSSPLAAGGTCTASISFSVDNGTGETDGDSGVTQLTANFTTAASNVNTGPLFTTITVTDPAVTPATPLPATLPLFASGLGALGLLGWRRKRKAGASLLGETAC
jgi:hypothetical protein